MMAWSVSVSRGSMEHICRFVGKAIQRQESRTLCSSIMCFRPYSNDPSERMMHFEEYRKLRKRLKIRARLAGVPMALVGTSLSSAINIHFNPQMLEFQNPEVELTPILGMDPLAFSVLCGITSGFAGFLLGGTIFNTTWKMLYRQKAKKMQERDDDFMKRLQKHRFSGINKFDDDYYGDKVGTLANYRQWVRKQQRKKDLADDSTTKNHE